MRGAGLEPALPVKWELAPQASASTNSATRAGGWMNVSFRGNEENCSTCKGSAANPTNVILLPVRSHAGSDPYHRRNTAEK